MIKLILLLFPIFGFSLDFQGFIGTEYRIFDNENSIKRDSSKAIEANIELKHRQSEYSYATTADFLKDYSEDSRTYARINEFYFTKHFENSDFSLGRRVYFMGALEVLNPVDIVSRQNFGRDPLDDRYRIGSYMALYEHYGEDMQITLMGYATQRADEFGDSLSPYNVFGVELNKKIESQNSNNYPSVMLKVQGTLDIDYALDYAFGVSRGYDNQRTFTENLKQKQWLSTSAFTYNTLAYENTLYKLEARIADVDENSDANMDDYIYWGAGVEYTLAAVYESIDVGILTEYYNWIRLDNKYSSADSMMILMQNDVFLGLRVAINNTSSTEFVGGVIFDVDDTREQNYYLQAKGRIFDTLMLDIDFRHMIPSRDRVTMLSLIGEHTRATINIRYYF